MCYPGFLRIRSISGKICRENQNAHFLGSKTFFPENRAVYETMWKNIVEQSRPQMGIWRMLIADCTKPMQQSGITKSAEKNS
jgi:hypothetical protein